MSHGQGGAEVSAAGGEPTPTCNHEAPICVTGDRTHALMAEGANASEDGTGRGTPIIAFHPTQDPISSTDGTTHAMGTGSKQGTATIAIATREVAQAITSNYGKQPDNSDTAEGPNLAISGMKVRRLTPCECERLQGWPDDHTLVPYRGKPMSDGPRYKIIGNGWALPCVAWVARRIVAECDRISHNVINRDTVTNTPNSPIEPQS
jgi:DNA (cytosine-5)-methyltransferase 1